MSNLEKWKQITALLLVDPNTNSYTRRWLFERLEAVRDAEHRAMGDEWRRLRAELLADTSISMWIRNEIGKEQPKEQVE